MLEFFFYVWNLIPEFTARSKYMILVNLYCLLNFVYNKTLLQRRRYTNSCSTCGPAASYVQLQAETPLRLWCG